MTTYRLTLRLALLDRGDPGEINRLYDHLNRPGPQGATWQQTLRQRRERMAFGRSIALRRVNRAGVPPRYRFTPAPATGARTPDGVSTRFGFVAPPRWHDIPYVDLQADIATRGHTPLREPPLIGSRRHHLIAATRHWPAGSPRIRALVRKLAPKGAPPRARLAALHRWVRTALPHGGPQRGARRPALETLDKGFGRCWERSDVLVSLLRSAGLPARQVAGWVARTGAHIWLEVLLPSNRWIGVDTDRPTLGIGADHIPLMTTEDGYLPIFVLRQPKLALVTP